MTADPYFREIYVSSPKWIPNRLVLETSCLPCADFDGPILQVPNEPFRAYRTSRGHHLFLIGRVVKSVNEVTGLFASMGADPAYLGFVEKRGVFRVRVSPKNQDGLGPFQAIYSLYGQIGQPRDEWGAFLARHDELCLRSGATLLV